MRGFAPGCAPSRQRLRTDLRGGALSPARARGVARKIRFMEADQCDLACSAPLAKIFLFFEMQISLCDLPSRHRKRTLAIVTNVGAGSGGRGRAGAQEGSQGGFYRPVSDRGARRRTALKRTAKTCGPDASAVGVKSRGGFASPTGRTKTYSRGDGVKQARSPGRARISRKAIAQGMPDCLRCTCMLVCAFFCASMHTRPRVQRAPGLPCALFIWGRRTKLKTSGASRRENAS